MRRKRTHVLVLNGHMRVPGQGALPRKGDWIHVSQKVKWPDRGTPWVEGVVEEVTHYYDTPGRDLPEVRVRIVHGSLVEKVTAIV